MITIQELSKELSKVNMELVGGESGIARSIEYVTILELPEKTTRIKEKGLILTTFQAFKNIDEILHHMKWLNQIGIGALGFHTAFYKTIPDEVVAYANETGLPLFFIPVETPYYRIFDIFKEIENNQLTNKTYEIYKLNEKLMESVFLEKDVSYIVHVIGNYINDTVILLDPYLKLAALWKNENQSRKEIEANVNFIINQHKENLLQTRFTKREGKIKFKDNYQKNISLTVIPIFSKLNFFGYMLIGQENFKDDYAEEVIKNGLRALSLTVQNRNPMKNHHKMKDIRIFENILTGNIKDIKDTDFHILIENLKYCVLLELTSLDQLHHYFQVLSEMFLTKDSNSIIWIYNKKIIGYLESTIEIDQIKKVLQEAPQVQIGISGIVHEPTLEQLQIMYRQSMISLEHCRMKGISYAFWDVIGVEKIAYSISKDILFKEFDEDILGPLMSYDKEKNTMLTETLYSYLKNFFNLQKSGSELFVHPNTVKYRLEKISSILEIDFHNPSQFSLLMVAFSIHYQKTKKIKS